MSCSFLFIIMINARNTVRFAYGLISFVTLIPFSFSLSQSQSQSQPVSFTPYFLSVGVCVFRCCHFELVHIIYDIYDLNGIFVSIYLRQFSMDESTFWYCYGLFDQINSKNSNLFFCCLLANCSKRENILNGKILIYFQLMDITETVDRWS